MTPRLFCLSIFFVVLFDLTRLWRAAVHPFKGVREFDCMLHKACEAGLEVSVSEAHVLLRTHAQSGGHDDGEDSIDREHGGFSVTHLKPLVRRRDLYSMKVSSILPFTDLTVMSILKRDLTILVSSFSVTTVADSVASFLGAYLKKSSVKL